MLKQPEGKTFVSEGQKGSPGLPKHLLTVNIPEQSIALTNYICLSNYQNCQSISKISTKDKRAVRDSNANILKSCISLKVLQFSDVVVVFRMQPGQTYVLHIHRSHLKAETQLPKIIICVLLATFIS